MSDHRFGPRQRKVMYRLDVAGLLADLDDRRRARGMSWRDIGRQTGTSSSLFTRMRQGKAPDPDSLVTLLAWVGRPTVYTVSRESRKDDGEATA